MSSVLPCPDPEPQTHNVQLKGEVARYKRKYTEKGQVSTPMIISKITNFTKITKIRARA